LVGSCFIRFHIILLQLLICALLLVESEDPRHFAYGYDRHVIRSDHGFGSGFSRATSIASAAGERAFAWKLVTGNW